MTTFRAIKKETAPVPASVVVLVPGHYADTWPHKPAEPTPVGLRLVSEGDFQTARAEAAKKAWDQFPDADLDSDERVDAFNDALAAWIVARGTTQHDDATKPWLEMAHDNVQIALTTGGLHFLFDQLVALYTERSPLSPEATDPELIRLCDALTNGTAWATADGSTVRRARRLLRRAMDLLAIG
jgi:hypothetical protein